MGFWFNNSTGKVGRLGLCLALVLGVLTPAEDSFAKKKRRKGKWKREIEQALDEMDAAIEENAEKIDTYRHGTRKVVLSGNARFGLTAREGEISSWEGILRFHPYWKLSDFMMCKADTQFALLGNVTDVFLFFANCGIIVDDYLTFKVGKFLAPFGYYQENIHVEWMIKFPDEPLPLGDDIIVPTSILGLLMKGVIPIGYDFKIRYELYTGNGGRLDIGENDPLDTGLVRYDNYSDNNQNKSVGGHVGIAPWPTTRIGASFYNSTVGDDNTAYAGVAVNVKGADFGYKDTSTNINGQFEFRAEWLEAKVDDVSYRGEPIFDNTRSGVFSFVSYRPSLVENNFWKNLEVLYRYDTLDMPTDGPLKDMERHTFCLDYWLMSSVVIKTAIEQYKIFHDPDEVGTSATFRLLHGVPGQQTAVVKESGDYTERKAYLVQLAVGF